MAITTSITWSITDAKRENSDGFVYEINYKIVGIATDSSIPKTVEHTVTNGHVIEDRTRTGNEIGFSSLTEAQMLDWVKAGIGSTNVNMWERIIPAHLGFVLNGEIIEGNASYIDPSSSSGLPW